jgi:hypothetical protein
MWSKEFMSETMHREYIIYALEWMKSFMYEKLLSNNIDQYKITDGLTRRLQQSWPIFPVVFIG